MTQTIAIPKARKIVQRKQQFSSTPH